MKKLIAILLLILGPAVLGALALAPQGSEWKSLKGLGKKNRLGEGVYFVYKSSGAKLKVGNNPLQVIVAHKPGKPDPGFTVQGEVAAASKSGTPGPGPQTLTRTKSGAYLFPVKIASPGAWEIRLTFLKAKKTVFRGRRTFTIKG